MKDAALSLKFRAWATERRRDQKKDTNEGTAYYRGLNNWNRVLAPIIHHYTIVVIRNHQDSIGNY